MDKFSGLLIKRQHLVKKANVQQYLLLYRDLQPGQNVYWNGFGQPPTLSFRADFDDIEFNRERQNKRELIKGRFAGGNLGWIVPEDLNLFGALYRKPIDKFTDSQQIVMGLIEKNGPMNIQQIKKETGMLVKEITPALHKLQEAFLLYEDYCDGEWDRSWYLLSEKFPDADMEKYTKIDALKELIMRFAYRMVKFDERMLKNFYKVPDKLIKQAIEQLIAEKKLVSTVEGYMRPDDVQILQTDGDVSARFVYPMHRNDPLYKVFEDEIKQVVEENVKEKEYDHDILQALLIDGKIVGASVGHFRNGPYDLNDVVCVMENADERKEEIIDAISAVNFGKKPIRFNGKEINA
ncbi:MAG: hypothetical protein IJX06_00210 [Clostridia bacterium]|nr:hypothetical protein [Clostridia bacterium]